jgi:hypothetical protein
MSAVIVRIPHPRALTNVRAAIDARAGYLGAAAADRARAKREASRAVLAGASTGWAYTQACRDLRGAEPATRPGGAA